MARQPTNPTFSLESLEAIVRANPELLAKIFKSVKDTSDTDKADQAIVKAFEKARYKNIVLLDRNKTLAEQASTATVLTYKRWLELGRIVKKGEKSIKARGYHIRLFHRDQTEPASADKLPAVSPIPPIKAKAKAIKPVATAQPQG